MELVNDVYEMFHRYQRGSRSLADNLQLSKEAVLQREQGGTGPLLSADEEEEYDIPDEIENVIGMLTPCMFGTGIFCCLQNKL